MTFLTVPIAADNFDQALEQAKAAETAGAEMIEFRLDYIENLSVDLAKKIISEFKSNLKKKMPFIVTCRDKKQGGARDYPIKLRIDILTAALQSGADYIDFEYDNFRMTENQEKILRINFRI